MIKKGDKLIIIADALEDDKSGTVYVRLSSDNQSHMTMLIENCKKAPEMMTTRLQDDTRTKDIKAGYNQALRECGVLEK